MEIRPPDTPPWLIGKPRVNLDLTKTKKADTDPKIFKENLKIIENKYKDHVPIYTDGSKDNERVGYGVHTPSRNLSGRLHPKASIFTAEATALLKAVEWMENHKDSKFTVFSDSKSCLQAILHHMPVNPLIRDIQKKTFDLKGKNKDVLFCWLPSHIGIEGNEEADEAAKRALTKTP